MRRALVIRNVQIGGRAGLDVRIEQGRIADIGERLGPCADDLDGRGGALIPGLADHHIHLLGLAAQASSVVLEGVASPQAFAARIEAALEARPDGAWLRVTGYHERMAGDLSLHDLDRLAPRHRLRVQHQTGSLWMLNSLALGSVCGDDDPPCVERDAQGARTGRIWRGDAWLRERIGAVPPPLAPIGRQLAAYGITALTDASVTTDATAAVQLANAVRNGDLPQRLRLMSGGALQAPADGAFVVGARKVLLDDHDLPDLDDFIACIAEARSWDRAVAVHCVTAGELAISLAAFEAAGAAPGDRIEHGGVIPQDAIGQLRRLGLTVVTQSAFVCERGDRYLAEVEPGEQADLYRCATLLSAGVPVAGSSDAPYASTDPWAAMATAVDRRTRSGRRLGESEQVTPEVALDMYLGDQVSPGAAPRRVEIGAQADLCLLNAPMCEVLEAPNAERVRATLLGGRLVHKAL